MKVQKFLTEANKQQVMRLLGWTIDQYAEYQESKGLEYIRKLIAADDWSVNNVAKAPLFWRWWVNHWNARDTEFIGWATGYKNRPFLLRQYESLNDVDGFEFWPHRVIMEQSYAYMIGDLNRQAVEAGV
ncbi:hypothetical protein FW774_17185 [Pedobacter sp. BS3]|uniref:hypothetical protein n=1 Tax=Pedobacter sp. BS3 TaxID=2567937 RepID=UPI0011EE3C9B|nr:hypothetical protein [Pedobacter sp. BS3]TZF81790.1 hypothetical protein FW774_17185 [Pedobacter sp. BS3]